jgi:hypothetical protein
VCVFDNTSASLHVHSTGKYREQCCAEIKAELDSLFADSVLEAVTQIVGNGAFETSFCGGLEVATVTSVKDTFRIQMQKVPINSYGFWIFLYPEVSSAFI